MHGPGIPSKIEAPSGEMNGVLRMLLRGFLRCRVARRRRKKQIHIPQQSHRPFFGMIFHSHGLSIPTRKDELHRLVRLRRPSGAVECHPARLHVHFLLRCSVPFLDGPLRFRGALKVELHFAAAKDASTHFFVLATLRMNCVVPLSRLFKDFYFYVLTPTPILLPCLCLPFGLQSKYRMLPGCLRKCDATLQ